ncbi:MAG: hypothetical protein QF598_02120 [Arenicellales bacterium]|jgi:citrate lyase synthetase|nr:hypothetical protein [Arenicellales bacterium]MDP6550692.1 hypothetical protein [Arenicellales bacterium]MDP6854276.1 hypothetical protein [Arenicellales bacterium]MDP6918394.1 hypothetical protein [Arenicellales bacterium]|tara:strand:+ start:44866 stop:45033 length:168 start_codon:yes stop_codon:yes gene_type:complete
MARIWSATLATMIVLTTRLLGTALVRLMHHLFVYTQPTERTLEKLEAVNAIFLKP